MSENQRETFTGKRVLALGNKTKLKAMKSPKFTVNVDDKTVTEKY